MFRYAEFSEKADFRKARISRLDFNGKARPTMIKGRVDFRQAQIFAAHFQDLVFESDVDFSDATFNSMLASASTKFLDQSSSAAASCTDAATVFRFLTFEGPTYFLRTRFCGQISLERVNFRSLTDWTGAEFITKETNNKPLLALSYVEFADLRLRWRQLPDVAQWVVTPENRIKSFLEIQPEGQAQGAATATTLQPLSQTLQDLEASFRRHGRLEDANEAYYHWRRAELREARQGEDLARRLHLELEWVGWGLLSGYGTRLSWILGWSLAVWFFFALIYANAGHLKRYPHPQVEHDFSFRLRPLEFPKAYLTRVPPARAESDSSQVESSFREQLTRSAIRFWNALRLSFVLLFKLGYRDTMISGRFFGYNLKYIVALEWLLGYLLLAALTVTLANTQPLLNRLLGGLF